MILKNETQLKIIESIFLKKNTTISELSEIMKIDRSNVSRNIQGLVDAEMVILSEKTNESRTGRKTNNITLNNKWGYNLAITVTTVAITTHLFGFGMEEIREKTFNVKLTEKNIVDELIKVIRYYDKYFNKLLAVSIAFPQGVDQTNSTLYSTGQFEFGMEFFPLKEKLERELPMNYYIINDANAGAMACYQNYKGNYQNIVYMYLTLQLSEHGEKTCSGSCTGTGAGIIINGKLYKGANSFSGEVADTVKLDHDYGITEEIGIDNLKAYFSEKPEDFFDDYIEGISEITYRIINFMDPEILVLGGFAYKLPDKVIEKIKKLTLKKTMSSALRKNIIETDKNSLKNISLGAVSSFMHELFTNYDNAKEVFEKIK